MKCKRLYPLLGLLCAVTLLVSCSGNPAETSTPEVSTESTTSTTLITTTTMAESTSSTADSTTAASVETSTSTTAKPTTTSVKTAAPTTSSTLAKTTTTVITTTTFPKTTFTSPGKTKISVRTEEIVIPGLKEEYYFLHITDSHMVICDEAILDLEGLGIGGTPQQRFDAFTSPAGVTAQEFFEEQLAYVSQNIKKLDAVLFTGDILDFHTYEANLYLEGILNSMPLPYMYVTGNHDARFYMELVVPSVEFTRVNDSYLQKMKIGEITIIGVDNMLSQYETA